MLVATLRLPSEKVPIPEYLFGFNVEKFCVGLSITWSVAAKPETVKSLVLLLSSSPKAELSSEDILKETAASFEEMDDLMEDMGLGDDDEEDDDEIDLT